jgi:hypothetical protein
MHPQGHLPPETSTGGKRKREDTTLKETGAVADRPAASKTVAAKKSKTTGEVVKTSADQPMIDKPITKKSTAKTSAEITEGTPVVETKMATATMMRDATGQGQKGTKTVTKTKPKAKETPKGNMNVTTSGGAGPKVVQTTAETTNKAKKTAVAQAKKTTDTKRTPATRKKNTASAKPATIDLSAMSSEESLPMDRAVTQGKLPKTASEDQEDTITRILLLDPGEEIDPSAIRRYEF